MEVVVEAAVQVLAGRGQDRTMLWKTVTFEDIVRLAGRRIALLDSLL